MRSKAKVSSKSQITIPAWARKALGIAPGEDVMLRLDDDHLVVERMKTLDDLRGALRGVYGDPDEYLRDLREDQGARDARIERAWRGE